MKKILAALRSFFPASRLFKVSACIADKIITLDIKAKNASGARVAAGEIIEDCGFLIDLSETH